MELKLKEIVDGFQAINTLSSLNLSGMGLVFEEAEALINLVKKITENVKLYERLNGDLAKTCGFVDNPEKPGTMILDPKSENYKENIEKYNQEHIKILDTEIKLDYSKITLNKKKLIDLGVTINQLIVLENFFNWG
jgi:cupin superfamily acireductone dioxygenase involved in methionine salvage